MEVKFNENQGMATLQLVGRLDTAAATTVQDEINQALANTPPTAQVVVDASQLDYISSSGLRIILALRKKYPSFEVIEAQPSVYEVFDITGFTKIIQVKKALRRISVEGCTEIGRGGVGVVYRLTEDSIVKVFRDGTTIDEVSREIKMAKEAFVLGMPTAISFDVVRVDNGNLGLVYELLNAETLSNCIRKNPDRLEEYSLLMGHLYSTLHAIHVDKNNSTIPNTHQVDEEALLHCAKYYSKEDIERLLYIHRSIPQGDCLLHCDLHPKNVMMQGDEPMLIDMGEVGYGNPIIEFAHVQSVMDTNIFEQLVGFPKEQGLILWDIALREYFKDKTDEEYELIRKKIKVASHVRKFNWLSLSDSFPQEWIDECKGLIKERVTDHWDEIKKMCDEGLTF